MSRANQTAQMRAVEAEKTAIQMMEKAGFLVGTGIQVSVDPNLPIMGYTHPEGRGYRIVVSGAAVDSIMIEGLLVHELSHIYRMRTGHPSHNGEEVEQVIASLPGKALQYEYQRKMNYDLTNNIQDLYADDIGVQTMRKSGGISPGVLTEFLQGWVSREPVKGHDVKRVRWANGWMMANNTRAIAQMTRQRIEDVGGKAADANKHFLSRVDSSIADRYEYFLNLLTNLREDITSDHYRILLSDYLGNFVKMVDVEHLARGLRSIRYRKTRI